MSAPPLGQLDYLVGQLVQLNLGVVPAGGTQLPLDIPTHQPLHVRIGLPLNHAGVLLDDSLQGQGGTLDVLLGPNTFSPPRPSG